MRVMTWTMAWVLAATGVAMAQQAKVENAGQKSGGVLILPFNATGGGDTAWVADALRQSLVSEIGRWRDGTTAIAPESAVAATKLDEAVKAGRAAGAERVVYGSYQLDGSGLKITGEVADVASGKSLGQIKAAGAVRDLFAIQDDMAAQVKGLATAPKVAKAAPALTPTKPAEPKGDLFSIKPSGGANGWTMAEFQDQSVWSSEVERASMEYRRCTSMLHCPAAMARYWAVRQAYEQQQAYLRRARGGR